MLAGAAFRYRRSKSDSLLATLSPHRINKKVHPRMAIQWFPGHMHLTKKAITERIKDIDVVMAFLVRCM